MNGNRIAIIAGLVLLVGGIAAGCSSRSTATAPSTVTTTATATVTVTQVETELPTAEPSESSMTSATTVARVPYVGNVLYPEAGPVKYVTWNEGTPYCDLDYAQTSIATGGTVEVYGTAVRLVQTADGVELKVGDVDVLAIVADGTKVGVVTDRGSESTTLSLHTADWGDVRNVEICRSGM